MQSTQTNKLDFDIDRLFFTGEHIREMEKFNKYDKRKIVEHFDDVAVNYEQIYLKAGYPDPKKCSDLVSEVTETCKLGKDVQILDFACGTGLVG